MTPIINPIWFYLMDVCGDLNAVLIVLCIAVGIMAAVCFVLHLMAVDENWRYDDDTRVKKTYTRMKKSFIALGIALLSVPAVPNKDTLLKMLIANTVTYENVESAKHEATDLVDYIIEKVDTLMDNKETEGGDE